jgi:hypothetical protein
MDMTFYERTGIGKEGVCVSSNLKYKVLTGIICNTESIWLLLDSQKEKLVISCMYRPPDSNIEYYDCIHDEFEKTVGTYDMYHISHCT